MKSFMSILCLIIVGALCFLDTASTADCTGRIEKFQVREHFVSSRSSSGWWGRRRTTYRISYKYVTRTRLKVSGCGSQCGGCGSSSIVQQRPCTVSVPRTRSTSYTCYYSARVRRWFRRRRVTKSKSCYRSTTSYTTEKYCCSGMVRVDTNTCRRCGVNRYGMSGTYAAPPSTEKDLNETMKSEGARYIIGGWVASQGRFPWQIRLSVSRGRGRALCGGVIIASRWLLTAAHCVYGSSASRSYAIVGDHRRLQTDGSERQHTFYRVIIHPSYKYTGSVTNYDIALVQTRTSMVFNGYVRPVCLPDSWKTFLTEEVVISGWGRISSSGPAANTLKYTYGIVQTDDKCTTKLSNMICADGRGYSTSCNGDSGGPMTIKMNGYATVIGLAWFGIRGCPTYKAFGYTDIGPYLPWIKKTTSL